MEGNEVKNVKKQNIAIVLGIIVIILIVAIIIITMNKNNSKSNNEEATQNVISNVETETSNNNDTYAEDVNLIMHSIGIDEDCAEGIVVQLRKVKASKLVEIEVLSQEKGYIVLVKDSNQNVYYLGLNDLGYLDIIRRDSLDGEILYAPLDD